MRAVAEGKKSEKRLPQKDKRRDLPPYALGAVLSQTPVAATF